MNYSHRSRRGISLIWVAILIVLMLLLLGMSVDMGRIMLTRHQLQNAADAAALAGARHVKSPFNNVASVYQAARDMVEANHIAGDPKDLEENPNNDPDGDVVLGRYVRSTKQFTPDILSANAVRVTTHTTLPLFFGNLFNRESVLLSRTATAMIGGGSQPGMIVLDQCASCSLQVQGNADVIVNDGDIHVNSSAPNALCVNGNPTIEAVNLNLGGSPGIHPLSYVPNAFVNRNVAPLPDPLCPVPSSTNCFYDPNESNPHEWDWCVCEPSIPTGYVPVDCSISSTCDSSSPININGGTHTLQPGYYPEGIWMTGGHVTMQPGTYIIGRRSSAPQNADYPPGLEVIGGTLVGHEVTLFLKATPGEDPQDNASTAEPCLNDPDNCSSGNNGLCQRGAAINISANSNVTLSPPTSGPFQSLTIFQARNNTAKARLRGGPSMDITGALYFPSTNELDPRGGAGGDLSNLIIANRVIVSGNIDMAVNYIGLFEVEDYIVFLVR